MRAVMAPSRVHSSSPSTSRPPPATCACEHRKEFTVWMKSLVLNGHGCTVYDSNGRVVYRVDNYGSRCSGDVYLMDVDGNIILYILKKKLAFGKWEGYKWLGQKKDPRPWFTVARPCSPFQWSRSRPSSSCSCELRSATGRVMRYTIDGECRAGKQGCLFVDDATGLAVAELKRKMTPSGVPLGDDVLTLVVERDVVDLSFVMGLVLVYGLMNNRM